MTRALLYALALSLLANLVLGLAWQTARVTIKANEGKAAIARAQAAEDANKRLAAAEKKADALRKLPPKVVTLVRENPSGCVLPKPVTDGLREQVRKTNETIALP
jgi:hypothetical protein